MEPIRIGRYSVYEAIASGGMATVHFGRFTGPAGFVRTVAVKRMHAHLCHDGQFAAMFVDEARLASRIRHPNVVPILDVLATADELLLAMEYVHGEALGRLVRGRRDGGAKVPAAVASAVACDVLEGLHAAHEATDEAGHPLGIVHRDVSPDNILVGADGTSRVLDFGVAKAVHRLQVTREGQVKGKIAYMAPEQVRGDAVARTTDVYAASVVLWEMLTGEPLFAGVRDAEIVDKILFGVVDAPAVHASNVPEAINGVVLRGLARDPSRRFATAREMVQAVRAAVRPASATEVGDWLEFVAGDALAARAAFLARIERGDRAASAEPYPGGPISSVARDDTADPNDDAAPTAVLPLTAAGSGKPRRRWLWVAAGVIAAGTFAGAVGLSREIRRAGGTAAPSIPPAPPNLSPGPVPSATGRPFAHEGPAADVLMPPLPSAQVAPADSPGPAPQGARRSRPLRPPPLHRRDCDPPYATDSDGTRHYKLECL